MNKIVFPLEPGSRSASVSFLQDALLLFLDRGFILPDDAGARRELAAGITEERQSQTYGDATAKAVSLFQRQNQFERSGRIDEQTALAINNLLRQLGMLDEGNGSLLEVVRTLELQGQTLSAISLDTHHLETIDSKIGKLGPVTPVSLHMRGEPVKALHDQLTSLGLSLPQNETADAVFGVGTRDLLLQVQAKYNLSRTGILDEATRNALDIAVGNANRPGRIEGRILMENGLPAANVKLRFVNKGFADQEEGLGAAETDALGFYSFEYPVTGVAVNAEVRALDGNGSEVRLSTPKVKIDRTAVINLVAPAAIQTQATEFKLLGNDLAKVVGDDLGKLALARENDDRPDVSLLHQSSDWDARLIVAAAQSAKANAVSGIAHDALYGVIRAGLPDDPEALAQVSPAAFETALTRANEVGVIALDADQLTAAKTGFETFALNTRRQTVVPGALSSVGDLLDKARIGDDLKPAFEKLVLMHEGDDASLWSAARAQGIPEGDISSLQVQGKLAYLTLNNAPLTESLQAEIPSPEQLETLVEKDLYRKEEWVNRLNALATDEGVVNPDKLAKLIPSAYAQPVLTDRLDAYSEQLAKQVRQSFPTQVVSRMLQNDELKMGGQHAELKEPVQNFLKTAVGKGFQLGRTPVDQFLKQNGETVFEGVSEADKLKAEQGAKLLTRAYQMTPNDEAMTTLLDLGFTSARQVVAIARNEFVERYWERFGSRKTTETVYDKSVQISSVSFNIYTLAKKVETTPPLLAISGSADRHQQSKENLKAVLKEYPTMESLFGTLDFCECEQCRSVLSPAAYLVDLLRFIDPSNADWEHTLADWKEKHNKKAYDGPDYKFLKPYDALVARRPDLPHLALTCENTNTALPYIDLVNEILEYYVAHQSLDEKAAYDTGDATSAELMAEPHNLIPQAYDTLKTARYPLNLPFDLWLETVRRFCDYFETPFWQLLDVFRPSNELFAPAVDPKAYYRSQIFAEYLHLSADEYAIFTAPDLTDWQKLYGYEAGEEALALAELKSAKTLSRKLGLSYKELTELIKTSFINPKLDELVTLRKLKLEVNEVFRYKKKVGYKPLTDEEVDELKSRLAQLTEAFKPDFDAEQWLTDAWDQNRFDRILVLRDPDASGSSFEETTVCYVDAVEADLAPIEFVKINLFVRLWKRLGWTIEETDRALTAFLPENGALTDTTLGKAMQTALVYLAHLEELNGLVSLGKNSRIKLLTLWRNLPTQGKNSLYAQTFLTRTILKEDAVFDDPLGQYLSKPGVPLRDHLPALQAALTLTANEISRILADGNTGDESGVDKATLTLANVSLLYRYGLLAKGLKLTISELIGLKTLSGLDPFRPLIPTELTDVKDDFPLQHTLPFVRVAQQLKTSNFTISDLEYLFRHRFDALGPYQVSESDQLAWIRPLATDLAGVETDYAVPTDADSVTDDALRQKMALVFAPDVVERFMVFWQNTFPYSATQEGVLPKNRLSAAIYGKNGVSVSYDEARQVQQVVHVGVLTETGMAALLAQIPEPAPEQVEAVAARQLFSALLQEIKDKSDQLFGAFFDNYFDGFLKFGDFAGAATAGKRLQLLGKILPFLRNRLIRQTVLRAMAAQTGGDPTLIETLLTNSGFLSIPEAADEPLLTHLGALGKRGLTAELFESADLSGVPKSKTRVSKVEIKDADNLNSARWRGFLEVPQSGAYRFYALLGKKDATVSLRFDGIPKPVLDATASKEKDEWSGFVELSAGTVYAFTWVAGNLQNGSFSLRVKGETTPKTELDSSPLLWLPQTEISRATDAYTLLAKALRLTQGLGLSERDVRHILANPADFGQVNWRLLPTKTVDINQEDAVKSVISLFTSWLQLLGYSAFRRDVGGDELITLFENARLKTETVEELHNRIASLTRRTPELVHEVANELQLTEFEKLADEAQMERLWQALQIVEKFGVSMKALKTWLTVRPDAAVAANVRNAVKARFEPETWQRIAKAIFDPLRQAKRDALVAYIRQLNKELVSVDKLFEYFLIDPGTEPVVQTSRLRLAISSLQTFIQRCFLNLEPRVHPSVLNARHWAWMKRYRVWEANRKIFLYPENWLEPEWRDDKTHLYKELEGSLLQGDVTNQLAEDALYVYLKKLDQLARLEIVTMYTEEQPFGPPTLHVIGRTYATPRQYFYRRYAYQMWTAWEPVNTEIEGDHIVAVMWRERLHLFWLTYIEKMQESAGGAKTDAKGSLGGMALNDLVAATVATAQSAGTRCLDFQLNWSEYFQGEWTVRESGGFGNLVYYTPPFNPSQLFVTVSTFPDADGGTDGRIQLVLHGINSYPPTFNVVSKNSRPQKSETMAAPPRSVYSNQSRFFNTFKGTGPLSVTFVQQVVTTDGNRVASQPAPQTILSKTGGPYVVLPGSNQMKLPNAEFAPLISPVFYADDLYTFFVEPSLTETTVDKWEGYTITRPSQKSKWADYVLNPPALSPTIPPKYQQEALRLPDASPHFDVVDSGALHQLKPNVDALTQPDVAVKFGDALIGRSGAIRDLSAAQLIRNSGINNLNL
ncbi:neuraminidase-like domain-containing protein [Larkinella terrae]|uniref:PA14 domain-containing protein n=1 Tax=Larkinella terrae TaxID=2025311 RepID=A0A7K0ETC1_9BACT|nr:neuraminidase-like domain-containing protein [Larkinella terrae]MRS64796.1 hypothetical protein [Larkinella terrae]